MGRVVSIAFIAVLIVAAILAVHARAQENIHSTDLEKFSGVYEVSPRQFIYIQPWPGDETKLAYSDETGQ